MTFLGLLVCPLERPADLHSVDDHVEEGEEVVLEALLPVAAQTLPQRQNEMGPDQVQVHRKGAVVCRVKDVLAGVHLHVMR